MFAEGLTIWIFALAVAVQSGGKSARKGATSILLLYDTFFAVG